MKMKAIQFLDNKTDESRSIDVDRPVPTQDRPVLVQVHYAALDTGTDAMIDHNLMGMFVHSRTNPLIVGWHYSGVIEEVLDEATSKFKAGDEVFGFLQYAPQTKQGTFAEYITVTLEELAKKPSTISHQVAAASTTEGITALQALRNEGGLQSTAGQHVLIVGAGGGVGSMAVMIAKRLGAKSVTAVCSSKDVDRVRSSRCADVIINRSETPNLWSDAVRGKTFDIIFDVPCVHSALRASKYLKRGGTYVSPLPSASLFALKLWGLFSGKKSKFIECHCNQQDLELLASWMVDGDLKFDIDSTFPASKLTEAMVRQRDRSKKGRVSIQVKGGFAP